MSKLIYLDNAATTQVYPEVLQEMLPYFSEVYSNPSAIYSFASESKKAVDKARTSVAELINAKTDEIYFTGGGSESDNWALRQPQTLMRPKENTSSQARSNITRSFTPVLTWRKKVLRLRM